MKLGIVGHEAAKFSDLNRGLALDEIECAVNRYKPETIVSGGCHLGGVDIWAEEYARAHGMDPIIHKPKRLQWSGPDGYQARNLKIAADSDVVLVIVVEALPDGYDGMRFPYCYHCKGRNPPHVKSGGCWTAWKAGRREWRIIP